MTEEALFELVLKTPVTEREGLLDQACAGQPELRSRVEALLQAAAASSAKVKPAAVDATSEAGPTQSYFSFDPAPGIVIAGRYTLVERIGEGGMGEVWIAKQSEPVKRKVALKLIKAGMDSKSVLQRFDQERQALAMMDHPNIAKVLDGGLTQDRRPYFVMELVNGLSLTRFCDDSKLGIRERLEIFIPICQAVQHAHQKGIVHRDLKPGNILITTIDGKPVPQVIDFGVAKATSGRLTDGSLSTQFGAVVGTLEYMSPEQAGFSGADIDTRADIYSLGVILYELLTGLRPLDSKRLKQAALTEMIRLIKEEEPSKPSTRLSTDEAAPSLAALRQIEPKKLTALLRGELDWVVMKCLEKNRDRRYETANGLARDIQRYLADEVVEARPPSAMYRLKKFVSRNVGKVLAASLVFLALVAGLAGTAWGLYRAEEARQDAVEAAQREAMERKKAEDKEAEANAVVKFFQDKVFAAGRPKGDYGGLGHDVELRKAIQFSLPSLATSFPDQPLVEARLRYTLATTFRLLGENEKALEQDELACTLFTRHLGPEHPDTLKCKTNLATCYHYLNRHDEALKLREATLASQKRVLPPDHPDTLNSMLNLASSYSALKRYDEALKLDEETLATQKRVLPPDDLNTLLCMLNVATSYANLNRHAEALKLYEETLAAQKRVLPPDHSSTLLTMNNLAGSYQALKRYDEALKLHEAVLAAQKRVLPPDHPNTLITMNNLANSYHALNRHDEALSLRMETLATRKRVFSSEHPDTLISMNNLALSYYAQKRYSEALKLFEETLAARKRVLPPDHLDTILTMSYLGNCYAAMNRHTDALKIDEELLAARKRVFPVDHPNILVSMNSLANSYFALNRLTEAQMLYEITLAAQKRVLPPDHLDTRKCMNNLAKCYATLNRHDEALKLYEETLAAQKRVLPPDHPDTLKTMFSLANCYFLLNRHPEALKLREETLAAQKRVIPPGHPDTFGSMVNLARSYRVAGRIEEAIKLLLEALPEMKANIPDHTYTFNCMVNLAGIYVEINRHVDAQPLINDILTKADRPGAPARIISQAIALHLQCCQKLGDVAGCRATAELLEKRKPADSENLYTLARYRAVAAALQAKVPDAVRLAQEDTDQAMVWLNKAVAAGYQDVAHMKKDPDLDALREREDFKKLMRNVEKDNSPARTKKP